MDSKRQQFEIKYEPQATMKSRRMFNVDVDTFVCYIVGTLCTCPIIYETLVVVKQ